jgi:hypothetical protein
MNEKTPFISVYLDIWIIQVFISYAGLVPGINVLYKEHISFPQLK